MHKKCTDCTLVLCRYHVLLQSMLNTSGTTRYQVVTTSSSLYHVICGLVIRYNVLAVNAIWCTSWTTSQIHYTGVNIMSFLYNQVYNTSYSSQYHVLLGLLLGYNVLQQSISCTACATSQIPLITAVNIMYFMDCQLDIMSYSSQYHVLHGLLARYHVLQQSISCPSWTASQYHVLLVKLVRYNVLQQSISCNSCTTIVRNHVEQQSISCTSWTTKKMYLLKTTSQQSI